MNATYTYYEKTVTVKNGIVVQSDTTLATVGEKVNTKTLVACGWKKLKVAPTYYAHGSTSSNRFLK